MNWKAVFQSLTTMGVVGMLLGCSSALATGASAEQGAVSDSPTQQAEVASEAEPEPPREQNCVPVRPAPPPGPTCEVSCSELVLRTGKARIAWSVGNRSQEDLLAAAGAPMRLETTVFKNGFDRGNYLTLPLGDSYDESVDSRKVTGADRGFRAYELQITDSTGAQSLREGAAADARGAEIFAVVEGLEPGLNYTWRMVVDAPSGEWLSPPVTCTAPVCPADLVGEEGPQ